MRFVRKKSTPPPCKNALNLACAHAEICAISLMEVVA